MVGGPGAQHADTIDLYLTGKVARLVGWADVVDLWSADRGGGGAQHADTIDAYLTGKVARLMGWADVVDLRSADLVGSATCRYH